jgi:hypothetical protein
MAQVVAVHGVGQQGAGPHQLHQDWYPALRDGLAAAGVSDSSEVSLVCAFYGSLFRPAGQVLATGDPPYRADDVNDPFEVGFLHALWAQAAATDPRVLGPEAEDTMLATPRSIQRALDALSNSRFFAGLAERTLIFDLKQVREYFRDPTLRYAAREQVARVVDNDTRVIVAHSLGSVVAYEALCAHPEWPIRSFVTLGSPLGIRNLIFERLEPPPAPLDSSPLRNGIWPGSARSWTNIADAGDLVALVKDLRPRFGPRVENFLVDNGATVHSILPYLSAKETGHAIVKGLEN